MIYRPRKLILSLIVGVSSVFFGLTSADSAQDKIRMGFVGGIDPAALVEQWSPLLDYLSARVGIPIEMVIKENYEGLVTALESGEIDLFEGGSFTHVAAMETGKAAPLAGEIWRAGEKDYTAVLVVRADDGINSLADLKQKRFAFTDLLSTSGYLLPRIMLAEAGIRQPENYFSQVILTGSHDRSVEALLEGAVDAIAVADFYDRLVPPEEAAKLAVIQRSKPIPNGPITVRKDFDAEISRRIKRTLLDYERDASQDVKVATTMEGFYDQDESAFEVVRMYAGEAKDLPPLSYAAPYRSIPTAVSARIAREKQDALLWMTGSFGIAVTLLVAMASLKRNRSSTIVGVTVSALVAVIASLFTIAQIHSLFSSINAFAIEKLGNVENTNLRIVAALSGAYQDDVKQVLKNTVADDAIGTAMVFRDGIVVASSDDFNTGASVVQLAKLGMLDEEGVDAIRVLDPIIMEGKRWGTLQISFSFKPVTDMIRRAMAQNVMAMAAAFLAGIAATIIVRLKFVRPLRSFSRSIERLREGESAEFAESDDELGRVASSLNKLGKDLTERKGLLELRDADQWWSGRGWDQEMTARHEDRIREMEETNEHFRHLRLSEAIGKSPAWLRCLREASIRSRDKDPVVIYGPTGSGKTGIARVIHALGPRAENPMGEFNCAEFASGDPLVTLGKLFGYGANCGITGIDKAGQRGVLEEFDGGTIFLDEVEILPHQAQQLLLLPLEGRPFNPAAGRGAPKVVNVRFIFATNEPLEDLAHSGKIRRDLLRRIQSRGIVFVPPLAERPGDIEALAVHFLALRNAHSDRLIGLSREAVAALAQHSYDRYNVSELKGVIDQAYDSASFDESGTIEPKHFGGIAKIADAGKGRADARATSPRSPSFTFDVDDMRELAVLRAHRFNIGKAERELGFKSDSKTLTNHLRGIIYSALSVCDWNREQAAKLIMGGSPDPSTEIRIAAKIEKYISSARHHLAMQTTSKLFNNLPQRHFAAVENLLEAVRKGKI